MRSILFCTMHITISPTSSSTWGEWGDGGRKGGREGGRKGNGYGQPKHCPSQLSTQWEPRSRASFIFKVVSTHTYMYVHTQLQIQNTKNEGQSAGSYPTQEGWKEGGVCSLNRSPPPDVCLGQAATHLSLPVFNC